MRTFLVAVFLMLCTSSPLDGAILVHFELVQVAPSGNSGSSLPFTGSDSMGTITSALRIRKKSGTEAVFANATGVGIGAAAEIVEHDSLIFDTPELLSPINGPYRFTGFKTLTLVGYDSGDSFTITDLNGVVGGSYIVPAITPVTATASSVDFDLTGAGFAAPVTSFHLLGAGGRSTTFQVSSITAEYVREATTVPEPSSFVALALLGGGVLVNRIRGRSRRHVNSVECHVA